MLCNTYSSHLILKICRLERCLSVSEGILLCRGPASSSRHPHRVTPNGLQPSSMGANTFGFLRYPPPPIHRIKNFFLVFKKMQSLQPLSKCPQPHVAKGYCIGDYVATNQPPSPRMFYQKAAIQKTQLAPRSPSFSDPEVMVTSVVKMLIGPTRMW